MKTPNLKTIQQNGEYGNLCAAHGVVTCEGDAIGVSGGAFKLPPHVKIIEAYFVNEALGATTTIQLDAIGDSGTTAIIPAASTVAAGKQPYDGKPITLDEETTITATIGGAAATGDVDVVVEYIYLGG